MTPERRREIAAMGGKAVKAESRAYSRDKELAARAGSLGGKAVPPSKRWFAVNARSAAQAGATARLREKTPAAEAVADSV